MGNKQQKRNNRKKQNVMSQSNAGLIDEKTLTQAIVKAYQIIEGKKKTEEEMIAKQKDSAKEVVKEKWYIEALFMLNVIFFPWKINKRFTINNQIYDGILVLFVSLILGLVGGIVWLVGLCTIGYGIVILCQGATVAIFAGMLGVGVLLMMFGSLFTLAGDEFSKVSDSNKIYAYSASMIALISCVVAVVSLIKQII